MTGLVTTYTTNICNKITWLKYLAGEHKCLKGDTKQQVAANMCQYYVTDNKHYSTGSKMFMSLSINNTQITTNACYMHRVSVSGNYIILFWGVKVNAQPVL